MIVVDASAVLELLFASPVGLVVAERIGESALAAPQLLSIECAQVLRRAEAKGDIATELAHELVGDLQLLDVDYVDHDLVLGRVWELRHNLTAYDAAYVAVAELLGAVLITTDERMSNAPANLARIEFVSIR